MAERKRWRRRWVVDDSGKWIPWLFKKLRREVIFEKGGVRVPWWQRKRLAETLEDGTNVFAARYAHNEHLDGLYYSRLGEYPVAVMRSRRVTLYPRWVLVAAVALTATFRDHWLPWVIIIAELYVTALVLWYPRDHPVRYLKLFKFKHFMIQAALVAAVVWTTYWNHLWLLWLLCLGGVYYLRALWVGDVTTLRKTGIAVYERAWKRRRTASIEGDDIKTSTESFWWPEIMSDLLGIGTVIVDYGEKQRVFISAVERHDKVLAIVDGIQHSTARADREAAEQQNTATFQAGLEAMAKGTFSPVALVHFHGSAAVRRMIKILIEDSDWRPPVSTPENLLPDGYVHGDGPVPGPDAEATVFHADAAEAFDPGPDTTQAEPPSPPTPSSQPRVFISGQDTEVVTRVRTLTRWQWFWHRLGHNAPSHRLVGHDIVDYCSRCNAVLRRADK